MALPLTIGNWNSNVNGYDLPLKLALSGGNLTTSTLGTDAIIGFYDNNSQKLTFMRGTGPSSQVFIGYVSPLNRSNTSAGQFVAGYFVAFAGTGGSAIESMFPWYATI